MEDKYIALFCPKEKRAQSIKCNESLSLKEIYSLLSYEDGMATPI